MYENDNTDTADSHHKNEELFEELQKYWRLVLSHMGKDYQHLIKLSSDSEALELVQSLCILEEIRYAENQVPENQDLTYEINQFKKQIQQQRIELDDKTQKIHKLLQKQTQLQEQNTELIKQLMKKEEENSSKIAQLQRELKDSNLNRQQTQIPSQMQSARSPTLQFSQSTKSSPQPREFRNLSTYFQTSISKLTKVSGVHNNNNNNTMKNNSNIIFR